MFVYVLVYLHIYRGVLHWHTDLSSPTFTRSLTRDASFSCVGITLLRDHLSSDEVVQRLSTWTLEEAPSDEVLIVFLELHRKIVCGRLICEFMHVYTVLTKLNKNNDRIYTGPTLFPALYAVNRL